MYTHSDLIKQIRQLGIRSDDALMVHSSMKAIGEVEGGAETVIAAFADALSEGLLMFPTHTWRDWNNKGNRFDPASEPSCVGVLTEYFRRHPGVIRSWHPTHSIAAFGEKAATFLAGEERTLTPCPRNGCWGRLYDVNAKILFLGATLKTNTFIHSIEEWHQIPNRISNNVTVFQIRTPTGEWIPCPQNRHDSSLGDVSVHYDKIEPALLARGIAVEGKIGSARSVCCEARPMADFVGELLKQDPHLFDDDRPVADQNTR